MGVNWAMLKVIAPFILVGLMLAFILAKQLTILSLGQTFFSRLRSKNHALYGIFPRASLDLIWCSAVALVGSFILVGYH